MASWPLPVPERKDMGTVDALARLALSARRAGVELRVVGLCRRMTELVELAGLTDVLVGPSPAALAAVGPSVDVGGEAELLEQGCVEEVVEPDDPVA